MRKEAKYNLIFFIVLLGLCTPGVIMLVKKKLQQEGDIRGGMSAPVPHQAVYVDPLPKGSNIRGLVIPPQTHAWAMGLGGRPAMEDRVIISQNRSFEVVDRRSTDAGTTLTVLLWDPRLAPDGGRLEAQVEQDGRLIDATVRSVEPITLPEEIRGELQRSGYSAAPAMIQLVRLELPKEVQTGMLILRRNDDRRPHEDRIDLEQITFPSRG